MEKTCTFFGHRNASDLLRTSLIKTISELILKENVRHFYVGTQGNFDRLVYSVLKELKRQYEDICFEQVLAYMPNEKYEIKESDHFLLPDGMEEIFPRFAIHYRNKWMIEHSDYVVTYVTYHWGGAAKFKAMAERKNKIVIALKEE